jgi:hypothetical protein
MKKMPEPTPGDNAGGPPVHLDVRTWHDLRKIWSQAPHGCGLVIGVVEDDRHRVTEPD